MDKNGTIHLLEGDRVWDVDRLANLYLKLTGRQPTSEELAKAQARLVQRGRAEHAWVPGRCH